MDPKKWHKLAETVKEIGDDMHHSMENDFSNIDKIEDPKQRELLKNIRNRTQEAIKNKDSESANGLIVELKDFLKNGR